MQAKLASCHLALHLPNHTCKTIFKYYGEVEKGLDGILEGLPNIQEGAEDIKQEQPADDAGEDEVARMAKVIRLLEQDDCEGGLDEQHSEGSDGRDADGFRERRGMEEGYNNQTADAGSPVVSPKGSRLNAELISQYIKGANVLQNGRVGGEIIKTVSQEWLSDALAPSALGEGHTSEGKAIPAASSPRAVPSGSPLPGMTHGSFKKMSSDVQATFDTLHLDKPLTPDPAMSDVFALDESSRNGKLNRNLASTKILDGTSAVNMKGSVVAKQDSAAPRRMLMPPAAPPQDDSHDEHKYKTTKLRSSDEEASQGKDKKKSKKLTPFSMYQSRDTGGETSE